MDNFDATNNAEEIFHDLKIISGNIGGRVKTLKRNVDRTIELHHLEENNVTQKFVVKTLKKPVQEEGVEGVNQFNWVL